MLNPAWLTDASIAHTTSWSGYMATSSAQTAIDPASQVSSTYARKTGTASGSLKKESIILSASQSTK